MIKITERVIVQVCAAKQVHRRRPTYTLAAAGRQDKLGQGEAPRGTRCGERQWEMRWRKTYLRVVVDRALDRVVGLPGSPLPPAAATACSGSGCGTCAAPDLERGFRSADPNLDIVPVMYLKSPLSSTKTAVTPQYCTKSDIAVPTGYHLDLWNIWKNLVQVQIIRSYIYSLDFVL